MEENTVTNEDFLDTKAYEVAFLMSPLVSEETKADLVASEIISAITKSGGSVVSQIAPQMRRLAYPIGKTINHKKTVFKDAYFGSIKFNTPVSNVAQVKDSLDKSEHIIRFLIVEVSVNSAPKDPKPRTTTKEGVASEEAKPEAQPVVDEQKIDQEIEGLLTA